MSNVGNAQNQGAQQSGDTLYNSFLKLDGMTTAGIDSMVSAKATSTDGTTPDPNVTSADGKYGYESLSGKSISSDDQALLDKATKNPGTAGGAGMYAKSLDGSKYFNVGSASGSYQQMVDSSVITNLSKNATDAAATKVKIPQEIKKLQSQVAQG